MVKDDDARAKVLARLRARVNCLETLAGRQPFAPVDPGYVDEPQLDHPPGGARGAPSGAKGTAPPATAARFRLGQQAGQGAPIGARDRGLCGVMPVAQAPAAADHDIAHGTARREQM